MGLLAGERGFAFSEHLLRVRITSPVSQLRAQVALAIDGTFMEARFTRNPRFLVTRAVYTHVLNRGGEGDPHPPRPSAESRLQ